MNKYVTLLTNLAVIASLVFLALEIRQNNSMLVLEARNAISDARNELVLTYMNNRELITAREKAARGEELTSVEETQILLFFFAAFRSWQDQFFSFQAGVITEEQMDSEALTWRRSIKVPYVAKEWQRQKPELTPEFVAFIEQSP